MQNKCGATHKLFDLEEPFDAVLFFIRIRDIGHCLVKLQPIEFNIIPINPIWIKI